MNLSHNRECASINGSGGLVKCGRVSSASSLLSKLKTNIEGVVEVENGLLIRLTACQGDLYSMHSDAYSKISPLPSLGYVYC